MMRKLRLTYPLTVELSEPQPHDEDQRVCINCEHFREDSKPSCWKYQMSVGSALMGYKDGSDGPCGVDRRGWADKNRFNRMLRGL